MAWRVKKKFKSFKEALEFYKQEYLGINTDIRGEKIYFTESAFPHLIDLSYQGDRNATVLLGKIYKGELTFKNSEYQHYRLCHLPSIKLLYTHPDEIWRDFKDEKYEHYLKYITLGKSKKIPAQTFLVKKTDKGFYVPVSCYPVHEGYLKKIKTTDLLWSK
ncbi:MAG: hypothetical protein NTW64_01840 [Candidatus Omnitrophica bacterium]|nr:hypothetical protein [Candidatus Omnitrophota bacterium]